MIFCTNCGSKVIEGAKFCSGCGFNLSQGNTNNTDNSRTNELRKKVGSEQYIVDFLRDSHITSLTVTPNISEKHLINSSKSIANNIDPTTIIALIDNSLFSNGKSGIVFTGSHMYIKGSFGDSQTIKYDSIVNVSYDVDITLNDKNEQIETKSITINYSGDELITIGSKTYGDNIPYNILADLLEGFEDNVDDVSSTSQIIQLNQMSDKIILLYFRIIITYLKAETGYINSEQYKELISLMTDLKLSKHIISELREYRFQNIEQLSMNKLLQELRQELKKDNISNTAVEQSLGMGLLNMHFDDLDNIKNNQTLIYVLKELNMDERQVKLTIRKMQLEKDVLEKRLTNNQISELSKELVALASGAGVSAGALVLTGAVTGWGASIWGGILGFGSVGIGLAAVATLGYGAYRGVKYFSGTGELEKYGIRVQALTDRISHLRVANTYIIDDINWLSKKTVEFAKKLKESNELSNELFDELEYIIQQNEILANTGNLIQEDEVNSEYELALAKVPEELNIGKYNELIVNHIQRVIYDSIIHDFYKVEEKDTENSDNTRETAKLADDISFEDLKKIESVLTDIGYFDTKSASVAQGKSMLKKGWSGLKNSLNSSDANE